MNALITHSSFPLVTRPTRSTKSSNTLINNIITNNSKLLHKSKTYMLMESISDHYPILFSATLDNTDTNSNISNRYHSTSRKLISLTETNRTDFTNNLSATDWSVDPDITNSNKNFQPFHNKLMGIVNTSLTIDTTFQS